MIAHKLATYKDGWKLVEYCQECGLEGSMLTWECKAVDKNSDKKIDKQSEQS